MIVANVEKLQYVLTFSRIDQVKYELYEKLKEIKQTQKKISNLDNPIKKIEYFNDNADQTLHQIDEILMRRQKTLRKVITRIFVLTRENNRV